ALVDSADEDVAAQQGSREDVNQRLGASRSGLDAGMSQGQEAQGQLSGMQEQLGGGGAALSSLGSLRAPQAPPADPDAGLLDRAAAWAREQAINLVVSRFTG